MPGHTLMINDQKYINLKFRGNMTV